VRDSATLLVIAITGWGQIKSDKHNRFKPKVPTDASDEFRPLEQLRPHDAWGAQKK